MFFKPIVPYYPEIKIKAKSERKAAEIVVKSLINKPNNYGNAFTFGDKISFLIKEEKYPIEKTIEAKLWGLIPARKYTITGIKWTYRCFYIYMGDNGEPVLGDEVIEEESPEDFEDEDFGEIY